MQIKILPKKVANQIAAGEVIERPASIAKELIENSIDAGATSVKVNISGAELSKITVLDDGAGMSPADLEMSVKRHATSKLTEVSDLNYIASLGFRGEALASIASVSKLEITSRQKDANSASKIEIHGGFMTSEITPSAGNYGTYISVSELFFNTPARKKFLKSVTTEMRHIKMTTLRLAISNPYLSFRLFHNEKLIFAFKSGELEECRKRFAFLVGKEFQGDSIYFSGKSDTAETFGWISRPTVSGASSSHQMRFINGRYVKDRSVDAAVRMGFRDIMFGNKLPPYLIYLYVDPGSIDINVHPSKEEVRFANPEEIKRLIRRSIQDALSADGFKTQLHSHSFNLGLQEKAKEIGDLSDNEQIRKFATKQSRSLVFTPSSSKDATYDIQKNSKKNTEEDQNISIDLGQAIGQIHDIFIFSQNSMGIIIVDMHAAHERINYEQLKREWSENKAIASQRLITPVLIKTSEEQAESIEHLCPKLELIGFEVIRSGVESITIHAHPAILKEKNLREMFSAFENDSVFPENIESIKQEIDKILANIACRSSLRAYDRISLPEMNALLRQIEKTKNSGYCSHGRPVWRFMSISELDKIFLRGK